jgi:hypothetical protein
MLLVDEEPADLCAAMANTADKLLALHSLQSHDVVANAINAGCSGSSLKSGGQRKKSKKQHDRRVTSGDRSHKKSALSHANFGDMAN